MGDTITIRVDGLRQLGEALRNLSDVTTRRLAAQATGAGARLVKAAAKANIISENAVDTGTVEKNIIAKKLSKSQTSLTSAHIITVKKVVYTADAEGGKRHSRKVALFLEFGTVYMAPRRFLGPALDRNISQATNAIRDKLKSGIEREWKRGGR